VPLSKESEDDGSTGGGPRRKQKIVSFFFLICDDDVDRTRTVCVKDERGEWHERDRVCGVEFHRGPLSAKGFLQPRKKRSEEKA
jgi:hypothetical protein